MCNACGSSACLGGCMTLTANTYQTTYQNTFGTAYQSLQPIYPGQGITGTIGQVNAPAGYSLFDFLEAIADKTDADACVFFIEKQLKNKARQAEELEQFKIQQQTALYKAEADFMFMCLKYRPTITPELIDKIKKLKAFY